jgi:hypothetical protein
MLSASALVKEVGFSLNKQLLGGIYVRFGATSYGLGPPPCQSPVSSRPPARSPRIGHGSADALTPAPARRSPLPALDYHARPAYGHRIRSLRRIAVQNAP